MSNYVIWGINMSHIAFVGLGQMGLPMAANLIKSGFKIKGFDINTEALSELLKKGGEVARSPSDAAKDAAFIITMLPNGELVDQAFFGKDGLAQAMSENALAIDMSTIHPSQSDQLRQKLSDIGRFMMDAPVGRTSDNAISGTLLILAGGTPEQIERTRPLFMSMGNEVIDAGGPGMGIRVKIINNTMSIALNALSAEVAVLCESLGLSLDVALKVMAGTAAGKGHFTTTWPNKVLKGDLSPAFMIDLAHKDLGIALDTANQLHSLMPLTATAREVYSGARAAGRGRQDWSAILAYLRAVSGHSTQL